MSDYYDDKSWHTPMFVDRILVQVESARVGADLDENTKPSSEMEEFIFNKSATREEYMALIARLLLYLREKSKSASSNFDSIQISAAKREEISNTLTEIRRGSMTD